MPPGIGGGPEAMTSKPTTAPLAYVYDGQQCLGHVLNRGKAGFEVFDRDDRSVGLFPSSSAAVAALVVKEGGS